MTTDFEFKADAAIRALTVMVLDHDIRTHLQENDPQALKQAVDALKDLGLTTEPAPTMNLYTWRWGGDPEGNDAGWNQAYAFTPVEAYAKAKDISPKMHETISSMQLVGPEYSKAVDKYWNTH